MLVVASGPAMVLLCPKFPVGRRPRIGDRRQSLGAHRLLHRGDRGGRRPAPGRRSTPGRRTTTRLRFSAACCLSLPEKPVARIIGLAADDSGRLVRAQTEKCRVTQMAFRGPFDEAHLGTIRGETHCISAICSAVTPPPHRDGLELGRSVNGHRPTWRGASCGEHVAAQPGREPCPDLGRETQVPPSS